MSLHVLSRAGPARSALGEHPARVDSPRPHVEARMMGIDAARGIAMLLVCASHVRVHFIDTAPMLYSLLTSVTRIATPTFLLLSGFVAAFVLSSSRAGVKVTLFDRGLFVLLVGHFVLNLEDLRYTSATEWIFGRVTVTDAIAVCLMGSVFVYRLSPKSLAAIGAALALASWPIAMLAAPESAIARYAGAVLFDLLSEASPLIDAAIIPYMSVFLIGMAISKSASAQLDRRKFDQVARKLALYGGGALILVVGGIAGWMLFKSFGAISTGSALELVQRGLDPRSKLPPSPAYLLFYGGCGLLIAAFCLVSKPRKLVEPCVRWVATIGRASLMCFVVQDWFFRLLPTVSGFEKASSVAFWIAYLAIGILMIHWLAFRWDTVGANRFLTVGLKRRERTPVRQ